MNLWRFSLYTFAGSFIWSLGLAYAGFMLGENWEDIRAVMRPFDIPILLILAAAGGWFLTRRIKSVRAQDKLYDAANQTPPDSSDE
jgi:membrane protein DedA with SNARE-associated domain